MCTIVVPFQIGNFCLLTYSTEQSPSWEANRFSPSQEITHILWNPQVHYLVHKYPPPAPILSLHPFRNKTSFCGEDLLAPRPTPNWRTTHCRLSAPAYSLYSQLPSMLEAVPPFTTWGSVMPCWQEPTHHGKIVNTLYTLYVSISDNTHMESQSVHETSRHLPRYLLMDVAKKKGGVATAVV